jgi:hypothetical protein
MMAKEKVHIIKDQKLLYNILYTINNEDVFYKNIWKYEIVGGIIEIMISTKLVWITSDFRLKLTSIGSGTISSLQNQLVDFEPKTVKSIIQKI